jgi:hypothetical protein
MAHLIRTARPILLLMLACVTAVAGEPPPRRGPVAAAVETTLATRGDHIRQQDRSADAGLEPSGPMGRDSMLTGIPRRPGPIAGTDRPARTG